MAQLAGTTCINCGGRVDGDFDSRFCPACGCPRHNACVRSATGVVGECPTCGAGREALAAYTGRRRSAKTEDSNRPRGPNECPVCETVSPPGTARCECGFCFAQAEPGGYRGLARRIALKNMFAGAAVFMLGFGITAVSMMAAEVSGCFVIVWGIMLVGAATFFRGLAKLLSSGRLPSGR